jgi:hypothetical protein
MSANSPNSPNSQPQDSTSAPGPPPTAFGQCAWCSRWLDANNDPVGDPTLHPPVGPTHGLCNECADRYFPAYAERLRLQHP